ncbi:hypothetical protein [Nonomuraea sp. NPDC050202]|jgi:hypothetical protein|uniref:hypothetical protein n=1 Tax=Nonomuraea sp. NPDC050202 TaxID=3155035 RepID=UPI0033F56BBB
MVVNPDVVIPAGYTLADLDTWSNVCATGKHEDCTGRYINPDPDCPVEMIELPCACGVCNHDQAPAKKRGRPRKTPAA